MAFLASDLLAHSILVKCDDYIGAHLTLIYNLDLIRPGGHRPNNVWYLIAKLKIIGENSKRGNLFFKYTSSDFKLFNIFFKNYLKISLDIL